MELVTDPLERREEDCVDDKRKEDKAYLGRMRLAREAHPGGVQVARPRFSRESFS